LCSCLLLLWAVFRAKQIPQDDCLHFNGCPLECAIMSSIY
jgi:hypothetical protein